MSTPVETVTALARRYRLDLDTASSDTAPVWVLVPGVAEFGEKIAPTQQDNSTYEDAGWTSAAVTALAWSIETTLMHRQHPTTGAFNAAQEQLKTASRSFGAASRVHVRYYDRNSAVPDAHEGWALVKWEPSGGKADDLDSVKVTLTGVGPLLDITNPAV